MDVKSKVNKGESEAKCGKVAFCHRYYLFRFPVTFSCGFGWKTHVYTYSMLVFLLSHGPDLNWGGIICIFLDMWLILFPSAVIPSPMLLSDVCLPPLFHSKSWNTSISTNVKLMLLGPQYLLVCYVLPENFQRLCPYPKTVSSLNSTTQKQWRVVQNIRLALGPNFVTLCLMRGLTTIMYT